MEKNCPSCNSEFTGNYCSNCGEKQMLPHERTMRYYLGRVINSITFAETKMLNTLWTIIRKPGTVTKDFSKGRRIVYSSPIGLFFIANLIYFLIPFLETFNTTLNVQTTMMPYSAFAKKQVNKKIEQREISFEEYEKSFNAATNSNAKLMLIIMVFLVCFGLAMICRKRDKFFGDYFILSLEINIFNLFVNTILLGLLLYPIVYLFAFMGVDLQPYINDKVITSIILISLGIYLFAAIKKAIQVTALSAAFRSLLMLGWIGISLQTYRFLLFLITYLTV